MITDAEAVRQQLSRILESRHFEASDRLRRLLRHLVERCITGDLDTLNQRHLAQDVFGRGERFDPETDAIVRVEMRKLRHALELYYARAADSGVLRISIPKGSYVPEVGVHEAKVPGRIPEKPEAARPTIAVLPFTSLDANPEDDFVATGLTEELMVALARAPDIAVVSRYASIQAAGQTGDSVTAGQQLGARFVLSGSVRRSETRTRITAHVHDADRAEQLWAESYDLDRAATDLLDVQERIAVHVIASVADNYSGVINRQLIDDLHHDRRAGSKAYEATLRFYHYLCRHSDDSYRAARAVLEEAIHIEPENAVVITMLADLIRAGHSLGFTDEPDPIERVMTMVNQALTLMPRNIMCRLSLCYALLHARRRYEVVENAQAIVDDARGSASQVGDAAQALAYAGEWERGCAILETQMSAMSFFPHFFRYPFFLRAFNAADYNEAANIAKQFDWGGSFFMAAAFKAAALGQLGRRTEARDAVDVLLKTRPQFPKRGRRYLSCFFVSEDLVNRIMEGLQRAGVAVDG